MGTPKGLPDFDRPFWDGNLAALGCSGFLHEGGIETGPGSAGGGETSLAHGAVRGNLRALPARPAQGFSVRAFRFIGPAPELLR